MKPDNIDAPEVWLRAIAMEGYDCDTGDTRPTLADALAAVAAERERIVRLLRDYADANLGNGGATASGALSDVATKIERLT